MQRNTHSVLQETSQSHVYHAHVTMKTDGASENLKFLSNTKTIPVQDEFTMTEEVEFGNYGDEPMDSLDQFIEIVKKTTMCSDINIFTSNL